MIQKLNDFVVPAGKRYLGEVDEFRFDVFPNKCIINKQLPGCGFTEYCLNEKSGEDVILASPRIMLINNKADQHPDVFLVVNEMDRDPDIDKDLNKEPKSSLGFENEKTEEEIEETKQLIKENNSRAYAKIKIEFYEYYKRMIKENKPIKILVTYDSYHIIKDIFKELNSTRFDNSYTVVDEFQSILHDSRFKSSTEMQFLQVLKSTNHVIFASATPMLEEYLNMLDEFDGLPYIELDWMTEDPMRIIKPDLDIKSMKSVGGKAKEIIQTYLDGNFESITVVRDGQPVTITSTEAVLYVNSVNHITSIIKKTGLNPDQVLILCSNTDGNRKKIVKRLGKSYSIGHVPNPNKGEKFPMFTFCTRTVYLGADFYSNCARTFIFSDSNIDSLAVDISEDLPQILGRQRLIENPWKNSATFYYRSICDYRKISKEKFQKRLDSKISKTDSLLSVYKNCSNNTDRYNLAEAYQKLAKSYNYKDDYVGVNVVYTNEGNKILVPRKNNLVYVNEIRAFNIQQLDYKDRFSVFAKITEKITPTDIVNMEITNFFFEYERKKTIYEKLKLFCELNLSDKALEIILSQIPDSDEVKSYYITLGPKRLYELGYNVSRIKRELGIVTFSPELLRITIQEEFKIGDKLTLLEIKERLIDLYSSINYQATPKATDLLEFFEVSECTLTVTGSTSGSKRRLRGFKLLSKK